MEFYISEKLSSSAVNNFLTDLSESGKTDVHSLIMYKDNELLLSLAPDPYSCTYKRQVYSVSKTLSATGIGILYDMGLINPDDKICDIFKDKIPKNPSDYLLQLTVRHLLTMTVGHDCCSMKRIATSNDGVKAFLEMEIVHKPGISYLYDTGASYMLSAIVTKKTSLSLFDFLYIHVFNPLGMSPVAWPFSGGEINEGGLGIKLSSEDYAKLALMYLNGGVYNGQRILSEDWVNQSLSPQSTGDLARSENWRCGYGYQFWNCTCGGYRADGAFGQYAIINREKNLILILFGESRDVETELELCLDFTESVFNNDSGREHNISLIKERLQSLYPPLVSDERKIPLTCYYLDNNANNFTLINLSCDGTTMQMNISDGQTMNCISAGNGKWIENSFTAKNFAPQLYSLIPDDRCEHCIFVASYTIVSDTYAEIKIKYLNNPHTSLVKIHFSDTFNLEINKATSPIAEEALVLNGTKISL